MAVLVRSARQASLWALKLITLSPTENPPVEIVILYFSTKAHKTSGKIYQQLVKLVFFVCKQITKKPGVYYLRPALLLRNAFACKKYKSVIK